MVSDWIGLRWKWWRQANLDAKAAISHNCLQTWCQNILPLFKKLSSERARNGLEQAKALIPQVSDMFYSPLTILHCDAVAFVLLRRALLLQLKVSVTPMQITSLTLTKTTSLLSCSGLRRRNVNTSSDVRLASDQFTSGRSKTEKNTQSLNHRQTEKFSSVLKCILDKANYWLVLVVPYLSKTDFKVAISQISQCARKLQSWVNNPCS